ncbi:MAG: phosphoadenosine phosphosulfate reductase family protein [Acidobacteria bacterium]|nr:phosphoadenosine phosphosulfate reductase family protein [Acidobacteriota bacterium]
MLSLDSTIKDAIANNCVIAYSVSGGKDGTAASLLVHDYLNAIHHTGPRVAIHADLGRIEHADSLPQCSKLAARLGIELIVVRRTQGDMISRWEQRWNDNKTRYTSLSCVKLIKPWSDDDGLFCRSELKIAPINRELTRRFPGQTIISVIGIRRQEGAKRADKPISQPAPGLQKARAGTKGHVWHPILELTTEGAFAVPDRFQFPPHPAYTLNGNTRVSCSACVLSSLHDLTASQNDERNHASYQQIVALELSSAFSFQPHC